MFDVTQELTTKTRRKSNTRSMNEDEHGSLYKTIKFLSIGSILPMYKIYFILLQAYRTEIFNC